MAIETPQQLRDRRRSTVFPNTTNLILANKHATLLDNLIDSFENLIGQKNSLLSGVVDPTVDNGSTGDFYLNLATLDLFGPKTTSTTAPWGTPVNLRGSGGTPSNPQFNPAAVIRLQQWASIYNPSATTTTVTVAQGFSNIWDWRSSTENYTNIMGGFNTSTSGRVSVANLERTFKQISVTAPSTLPTSDTTVVWDADDTPFIRYTTEGKWQINRRQDEVTANTRFTNYHRTNGSPEGVAFVNSDNTLEQGLPSPITLIINEPDTGDVVHSRRLEFTFYFQYGLNNPYQIRTGITMNVSEPFTSSGYYDLYTFVRTDINGSFVIQARTRVSGNQKLVDLRIKNGEINIGNNTLSVRSVAQVEDVTKLTTEPASDDWVTFSTISSSTAFEVVGNHLTLANHPYPNGTTNWVPVIRNTSAELFECNDVAIVHQFDLSGFEWLDTYECYGSEPTTAFNHDTIITLLQNHYRDKWDHGIAYLHRVAAAPEVSAKINFQDGIQLGGVDFDPDYFWEWRCSGTFADWR